MLLKKLVNKSYYGCVGYIKDNSSISQLQNYLAYSHTTLKEYKGHIFAFNYDSFDETLLELTIKSFFPDAVILFSSENRGYNFGNADLDNLLVDYCKENNIEWLCKSAEDIIIQESILDKSIEEADFYYFNGIGYGGMESYNFDYDQIIQNDFFPQTNFYFINVSKIDYLNNKDYLTETYNYVHSLPEFNGRVWEYIKDWSCEGFLKECITRNNLTKYHLVSEGSYRILLDMVKNFRMADPSHKNILIEGVCHLADPNSQVFEI